MKGRTHISIKRERTVEHLDPKSSTHAADQTASKKARDEIKQMLADRLDVRPLDHLKFPSLGGGFLVDREGKELTGPEHKKLLLDVAKARSWYWSEGERVGGAKRRRKRKTDGLHALAVLFRPDYAAAFAALDQNPKYRHLVRPFFNDVFGAVSTEFEASTGLKVIAGQGHPEESVFHLHLSYVSVSEDNELLWSRKQKGRHGLRLLGPSHCGTLRLVDAGFLSVADGSLACKDFTDRVCHLNGDLPVDWKLCQVVDGLCENFADKHGLRPVFAEAAARYRADLKTRRAERPTELKRAKARVEAERDALALQVTDLKAKLAAGSVAPSAPSSPISQVPALPPLPPIFLQRVDRSAR